MVVNRIVTTEQHEVLDIPFDYWAGSLWGMCAGTSPILLDNAIEDFSSCHKITYFDVGELPNIIPLTYCSY